MRGRGADSRLLRPNPRAKVTRPCRFCHVESTLRHFPVKDGIDSNFFIHVIEMTGYFLKTTLLPETPLKMFFFFFLIRSLP